MSLSIPPPLPFPTLPHSRIPIFKEIFFTFSKRSCLPTSPSKKEPHLKLAAGAPLTCLLQSPMLAQGPPQHSSPLPWTPPMKPPPYKHHMEVGTAPLVPPRNHALHPAIPKKFPQIFRDPVYTLHLMKRKSQLKDVSWSSADIHISLHQARRLCPLAFPSCKTTGLCSLAFPAALPSQPCRKNQPMCCT